MATIYRKYRPQVFGEVFGQEHIVDTLKKALELDRVAHAYLFTGARGVGKTTVARILAKAVNCLEEKERPCGKCANCKSISENKFMDLIEIDAASNRGIDEIRQLRDKIQFAPSVGKKRVYIIDEVHMLTREAFNALLKTLEEPPEHTIFIFATTEAHKVPVTVLSRCQRFDFQLANEELVKTSLRKVAAAEKLKIADEVVDLIARTSGGSFRDSQSLLDQLSSHLVGQSISLEQALSILNLTSVQEVDNFIVLLEEKKAKEAIDLIEKLKVKGINFAEFLSMTVVEVRRRLIVKLRNGEKGDWESEILKKFISAQGQMKISPVESLPLELAVYESCFEKPQTSAPRTQESAEDEKKKKADEEGNAKTAETKPKPAKKPVMSKDLKMAIVDEVSSRKKTLGTLLATCSISEGKGEITVLTEYPFHRDTITKEQNLLLIEEVVGTILDHKVKINCQVQKEEDIADEIDSVFG